MRRRKRVIGEQGRVGIALAALLGAAALLARPQGEANVPAMLGWGLFALALALSLWPQPRRDAACEDDEPNQSVEPPKPTAQARKPTIKPGAVSTKRRGS